MIRKFLNSRVEVLGITYSSQDNALINNPETFFIQNEKINDDFQIIEYCFKNEICDLIPLSITGASNGTIKQNTYSDEKIKEYSEIVLNNDPFYKYSGATLGAIIEAKDVNWINKALKEMRNEYIKTRIEYLAKAYNLI